MVDKVSQYMVDEAITYSVTAIKADVDSDNNRIDKNIILGDGSYDSVHAEKDGIYISRTITTIPNCHGYADRTILSSVPDGWGYGVYDAVVTLNGATEQQHIYSFQDRTIFNGSGNLQDMGGFFSQPTLSGTGNIDYRYGARIKNVLISGGSTTLQNQYGVYIENLSSSFNNVGIQCDMTSGHSFRSHAGAKMYQKGEAGFGLDAITGAPVAFTGDNSTTRGILDTDSSKGVSIGTVDSDVVSICTSGVARVQYDNNPSVKALTGSADVEYSLGSVAKRWLYGFIRYLRPGDGTVIWTSGSGSPEGVVNGVVGSLYTRTNGGAGTTLYVKESGSGNTGWVAK